MRCLRFAGVASLICAFAVSAQGANILLIGTEVGGESEEEFRQVLQSLGHFVPKPAQSFGGGLPTAVDLVETDLIIMSRSANSGNYDDGTEPAQWNALNVPLILMNPAMSRGQPSTGGAPRWGWLNNNATVDNQPVPTNYDAFPNPAHPFVVGRSTDAFPSGVTIDYVNAVAAEVPGGATIVANMSLTTTQDPPQNHTFASIVDYPAGTTLFADAQGTQTTTTARRALFQIWEYPDIANRAFELTPNGNMILDQMIRTLAPTTQVPADVNGSGTTDNADYNIIRMNMFGTGKTYAQGDVTGDGNVNYADFRHWKNFNGATAGAGAGLAAVPEPGSIALALFGALAMVGVAKRRNVR